jgi:HEAT repeat protein
VTSALAGIGVVALPYLIQALTNKKEWVRGRVAIHLANVISNHNVPISEVKMAVPLLIGNLRDSNSFVRAETAPALKEIDPEAAAKAGVQ